MGSIPQYALVPLLLATHLCSSSVRKVAAVDLGAQEEAVGQDQSQLPLC